MGNQVTAISKCSGEGCQRRETCYRYTANADGPWQSYFSAPPGCEDGICPDYWENEGGNDDRNET
jgi:hypothetical protein